MEEQSKKLSGAVVLAASILKDSDKTDFIVCAVQRDGEGNVVAAAISNNLAWRDPDKPQMQPPSIGMMTDLLVEAELFTKIQKLQQGSWRAEESKNVSADLHQGLPS